MTGPEVEAPPGQCETGLIVEVADTTDGRCDVVGPHQVLRHSLPDQIGYDQLTLIEDHSLLERAGRA